MGISFDVYKKQIEYFTEHGDTLKGAHALVTMNNILSKDDANKLYEQYCHERNK